MFGTVITLCVVLIGTSDARGEMIYDWEDSAGGLTGVLKVNETSWTNAPHLVSSAMEDATTIFEFAELGLVWTEPGIRDMLINQFVGGG